MTNEEKEILEQAEAIKQKEASKKVLKKKKAFSKVVVTLSFIFGAVMLIFSMLLMWVTKDTSALGQLIIGACGFVGTVVAFYINMAKAEHIQCTSTSEIDDRYKEE